MNPQQQTSAVFELLGRVTFENALLKGDLAQAQAQLQKVQEVLKKQEENKESKHE